MIRQGIAEAGMGARVVFEDRWISEDDKVRRLENALAIAYTPFDEDGIGYPCEEAAHAHRPVIATTDAGAVLEFVNHDLNGLVVEPEPEAIAEAMDRLYLDRALARRYGEANFARLATLEDRLGRGRARSLTDEGAGPQHDGSLRPRRRRGPGR